MSDSNQELRNRLDLALFEALTPWLPERDRQPAVNALTEAVMSVLQDQGWLPAEVLDTEYDEYFCRTVFEAVNLHELRRHARGDVAPDAGY